VVGGFQRRLAESDLVVLVGPAGWVFHGGVDVFESNGEVDVEKVEVVNAVVLELLLADRPNLLRVVERVPELADDEKVLALDEALLDGAGVSLAGFLLVAVI